MRRILLVAWAALALAGCSDVIREENTIDGLNATDWAAAAKHEDVEVRRKAVEKLGELGPDEVDVTVPALIEAIKDPDAHVRLLAIEAVGKLGPKARKAQRAVEGAFNDPNKIVMRAAFRVAIQLERSRPGGIELKSKG